MGDLECELGQGETGVLGAGPHPENARIFRWAVGVQPEAGGSQRILGTREAQSPESYVMALAWAVTNRLLETDVLAASVKKEGAEGGGRIGRVEDECADHAP